MSRLPLVLAVVAMLAGMPSARAATVVILWPPAASADVTQALTLLRGELLSVGLEVTRSDRRSASEREGTNPLAWLEALAAQGAGAVVDPLGDEVLAAVDVWIVKTSPQRFEVTHVAVEPDAPRRPELLALRAVEALRAGLLQIDWAARKRREEAVATPPAAAVATVAPARVARADDRMGLEAGAVGLMSLDGLGPAVLSTVRMTWAARPSLLVQAAVAGLGTRSAVTTLAGSAQVAQQYVLLGAHYRLRAGGRVWPIFGVAAGALRTSIEGQSGAGTGGHTAQRWSGLFDTSLGAGLRLGGRYYLTVAAHAQVAQPFVAIHIVDGVGATSGRPNLLLTLTVGAWL